MDINDLKNLAERCRVPMHAACRRSRMAVSTPFRWGRGTTPARGQVERLRLAILQEAVARGTLPQDLADQVPDMPAEDADNRQLARELRSIADRLEARAG